MHYCCHVSIDTDHIEAERNQLKLARYAESLPEYSGLPFSKAVFNCEGSALPADRKNRPVRRRLLLIVGLNLV